MFYEITGDTKYLAASVHCADALAKNISHVVVTPDTFAPTQVLQSPWPFRVNARTGVIVDAYCSNVIEPIRLFEELLRISSRLPLTDEKCKAWRSARDIAWNWLFSREGPMKTNIWNGYFEDVANDSTQANRVQITALETARYLIKNPDSDSLLNYDIPAILNWVAAAFSEPGKPGIKEQTWCYEFMGSHTARYASVCALWYEHTHDEHFKQEAFQNFNFATYMTDRNGVVRVGPDWPGSWFSDGYSDYIKHFAEGLGAIPEWSPAGEDHLVRSRSVITKIAYRQGAILYTTFDPSSDDVLRLSFKPKRITAGGTLVPESKTAGEPVGWTWQTHAEGGIVTIHHQKPDVVITR